MKSRKKTAVFLMLAGLLLLLAIGTASCDASGSKSQGIDAQLRAIITEQDLTGDPSVGRDLPNIEDPLPQLGMLLFYSQALSGIGDSACVSCHHPTLGGGDGIPMSIGVDAHDPALLGPGRTHPEGPLVPRNAPTTFNAGMWDQFMFHDGRIESMGKTPGAGGNDGYGIRTPDRPWGYPDVLAGENLAVAQARFPVTSAEEMRGFDFGTGHGNTLEVRDELTRDLLAQIVGDYGTGKGVLATNSWLAEFQKGYQSTESAEELVTFENIVHAIGEYERSQVFVNTPWKAYVEGDEDALSESAKRGAVLFFTSVADGGANCASCHSGDFFTDEQFYALAVPQIGVGKDSGTYGDDDWGRYLETQRDADKYAFRTPTLLNVEVTGPYGHDGAYATLEGIIRHHLNPAEAIANYDFTQFDASIRTVNAEFYTAQALEQLQANRENGVVTVMDIDLTDEQVNDLLNFLLALTDPCVKDRACLAPWIPDADTPDPDGLRLNAVDEHGSGL
jgi:cytochrome c peroxidase